MLQQLLLQGRTRNGVLKHVWEAIDKENIEIMPR